MKKTISLLVIGMMMASMISIYSASDAQMTLHERFSFSDLKVYESEGRSMLSIEGAEDAQVRSNHYEVPSHKQTYTFSPGTSIDSITCSPSEVHIRVIDLPLQVVPVSQASSVDGELTSVAREPCANDGWFDYTVGFGLIDEEERGVIVTIEMYPARYDPEGEVITWVEAMEVEIEYTIGEEPMSADDGLFELLILTPDKYEGELTSLVDHKESIDTATKLVTLGEIYDETYFPREGRDAAERVKYFIKNAIEQWGVTYVLLIGGSSDFPARETHVYMSEDDHENFVSDLYYADIYNSSGEFSSWDTNNNRRYCEYNWDDEGYTDEIDFYPDVYLGRLPVTGSDELEGVIDKIIAYETSVSYAQDWFNDVIVVGGDTFPGDDDQVSEGEYVNEHIMAVMDDFTVDTLWASEGDLSGMPSGLTRIKQAFNGGAGFVHMAGHGNPTTWATHPFEDDHTWLPSPAGGLFCSNVNTLLNSDKLFILVLGACSVSKYNAEPDCISWRFVANDDGGAIASFGCSGLGYGYMGSYTTQGLGGKLEIDMFKAYAEQYAGTIGEMFGMGISTYIPSDLDEGEYKMLAEYHLFGDPSIAIRDDAEPPQEPALTGPSQGYVGLEYSFEAVSIDPEGYEVSYQFDWGDGEISGWTDLAASGQTTTESHYWGSEGSYEVRVRAKNQRGAISDWSTATGLEVSPPQVDILISGGLGTISAEARNTASEGFDDIEWTLEVVGGLFGRINMTSDGVIPRFDSDETEMVSLDEFVFGLGRVDITVCCGGTIKEAQALVWGIFVVVA